MLDELYKLVLAEYSKSNTPWIVTYSGGKDSSVILDLTLKAAQAFPNGQHIYIISNDTRVESPLVINHLKTMHGVIAKHIEQTKISASVHMTQPRLWNSFWVNLIGKGYPSPTQMFRWCTTRLKIDPTSDFIKTEIPASKTIMVIGTREQESASRKQVIAKHAQSAYFSTHSTLDKCTIFMPIRYLSTDDVWEYLAETTPPWGGDYMDLINLYREAYGGECPVVADMAQLKQPSCGERSPRFGCWTCTLVKDDSSLKGLIDTGYKGLQPLYDFRAWLVETREDKSNRLPYNRRGEVRYKSGKLVYGAYTLNFREKILEKLLEAQIKANNELISQKEISFIKNQWADDIKFHKIYEGVKIPKLQYEPSDCVICGL